MGEHSEESNLLRNFRDGVLTGSETGKDLVWLYYQHATELASIITEHREIRTGAKRILMSMIPAIKSSLNSGTITISCDTEEAINDLCAAISREAGPELTEVIVRLKKEFNQGRLP
jgi:hypothetical protein